LSKVECYSNRLMFVKVSTKPVDIVLVQVYMPTMDHDDDDTALRRKSSSEYHNDEDFNSIVGEGSTNKLVGPLGPCKRNERGKMLITFLQAT
jgi:hypothetical protein